MAFTSASGIGSAARIWGLSLLLTTAPAAHALTGAGATADPGEGVPVRLILTGLRNDHGQVLICLSRNAAAFPDCSKDAGAVRRAVRTASIDAAQGLVLRAPRAGHYAIAVVHDENASGRLDTMLMMPREGFGFSRNPALRMGPPRFRDAAFDLDAGGTTQSVRVRYML